MRTEQLYAIDVVKYLMAFCVIAIHTLPLKNGHNEVLIKFFNTGVSIAVPFFFLSSGYLIARKFSGNKKSNLFLIDKQIKKLLQYYIIWTLIYLPLTIYGFIQSGDGLKKSCGLFFRNLVFQGENYYSWPLWFLLSSIYGFIIFRFIVKYSKAFNMWCTIAICIFVAFYFTTDYLITVNVNDAGLRLIAVLLEKTVGKGRMFSGTFYILMGALIAECDFSMKNKRLAVIFGVLYLVTAFSGFGLMKILMCISFFAFVLFIRVEKHNGRYFRRTSTIMYYTHMLFFFLLKLLFKQDMYGFMGFMVCSVMTNIMAYVLNTARYKNNKWITTLFGSI